MTLTLSPHTPTLADPGSKVAPDSLGQKIRDLHVTGNCFSAARLRILPKRVFLTFPAKDAPGLPQVPKKSLRASQALASLPAESSATIPRGVAQGLERSLPADPRDIPP